MHESDTNRPCYNCYRVLDVALPALIGAAVSRSHPPPPPTTTPAAWRAAVAGAELELLSRSLPALERYWNGSSSAAAGDAAGPASAGGGTAVPVPEDAAQQQTQWRKAGCEKQEAFDAMLVHISALCHRLTVAADPHASNAQHTATVSAGTPAAASAADTASETTAGVDAAGAAGDAGAPGATDSGGMGAATLAALLAQRTFGELAAAVTVAAAQGLACGRASTLLLHLLKVGSTRKAGAF